MVSPPVLVSLPLAAYGFVLLGFLRRGVDARSAALHAATLWGAGAVIITEFLSALTWFTWVGLAACWLAFAAAAVVWMARAPAIRRSPAAGRHEAGLSTWGRAADFGLLAGVGVVGGIVGVVALLSPPNTWDAMQYHLPRVAHWLQNRSVADYPTHELKQLHMPPGAEFVMAHLNALWGGDRLANLVQWCAFVGSIVAVTVIARSLGAGPRGQILAAVVCATIPEGLLAASGAKNDWVLSFWMAALVSYALRYSEDPTYRYAGGLGATLGLTWLTKGTGYVLAIPLLATLALCWPWKAKLALVRQAPLIVLLAVGLNTGHYARNWHLYGSPLGPGAEGPRGTFKYTNDVVSLASIASNVLRNTALHVRSEHRAANEVTEAWLARTIHHLGGNVDDPRTNFFELDPFRLPEVQLREGFAGNTVHLGLVALTLLILGVTGYRLDRRAAAVYSLALVGSYLAFCAILKWQPTAARLHLPLFVLWSAPIGAVLGAAWPPAFSRSVAALLLILSVPVALGNVLRPLSLRGTFSVLRSDRHHLYFADRPSVEDAYVTAARVAQEDGCRRIGLDLANNVGWQYEYPLLALLGVPEGRTEVRAVGVTNRSAVSPPGDGSFAPCAVICVLCAQDTDKWTRYHATGGKPVVVDDIVVFTVKP